MAVSTVFHISLIGFCIFAMLWTPAIVPSTEATRHLFSEHRAMQHVATLAAYERQVSTPGVERAAAYIHDYANTIAALALRTRPDLRVDVLREQHSGAVGFSLFGAQLTNIYANITNIAVRVAATSSNTTNNNNASSAFLINAHYDSTLGSSGASDCASCVGVALEALRAMIESPVGSAPPSPVVFLLNGGEETFMQGAAGFASDGAWRNQVGAFLNLESTGTHGLPILFQHTSSWAADVYAASTPAPRGTALSQDFFSTGIIPADTDYKVLAGPGSSIPGIDVAYVLGGAVYHTSRDAVENIRPGTVQEMGEMVMGCIKGFTAALAEPDVAQQAAPDSGAYYFDLFWVMVRYSKATVGPWLHGLPLLALAMAPLLVAQLTAQPVLLICAATADSMKDAFASAMCAVLIPLAVGAARALLLGNPMVFFAHHWSAYAMYLPCALAGALLPYATQQAAFRDNNRDPLIAALGAGWAWGILGAVATRAQLGVAIYPFLWTAPLPLLVPLLTVCPSAAWRVCGLLIGTAPASIVGISSMLTLIEHLMGRLTMAGAHPGALGTALADMVVGALMGVGAVVAAGPLLPAYGTAAGAARTRRAIAALLCAGVLASLLASAALTPYGIDHPKRLYVQHLHTVQPDGSLDAYMVAATTDVHPVRPLMADPTGVWDAEEDMLRFAYPLADKLQGVALRAPVNDNVLGTRLPSLHVTDRSPGGLAPNTTRLTLHIDTIRPCWAIISLKGARVHRWSLDTPITTVMHQGEPAYMLRVAGNHKAGSQLGLWVEVDDSNRLWVQLTAKYLESTEYLQRFGAQFAEHVDVTGLTVYHSDWAVAANGEVERSAVWGGGHRPLTAAAGNCSVGGVPVVLDRLAMAAVSSA